MRGEMRSSLGVLIVAAGLSACSIGGGGAPAASAPTPTAAIGAVAPAPTGDAGGPAAVPTLPAAPTAVLGATATAPALATVAEAATITSTVGPTAAATVQPTEAATARPAGEATEAPATLPAGYRRFASRISPYSIGYPSFFRVRGDASELRRSGVRGDLFVSRRPGRDAISANVIAEQLPRGSNIDSSRYADLSIGVIERSTDAEVRRAGETTVAGERAYLIEWTDRSRPRRTTEITQALFVAGGRGWVVSFGAPPGRRAANRPIIDSMLRTFQLRGR